MASPSGDESPSNGCLHQKGLFQTNGSESGKHGGLGGPAGESKWPSSWSFDRIGKWQARWRRG